MKILCPLCKKQLDDVPEDFPSRPFCSPRCKLVDLGNWLNEEYRVSEPVNLEREERQNPRFEPN